MSAWWLQPAPHFSIDCRGLGDASDLLTGDSDSEDDPPDTSRPPFIVIISPMPLSGPGENDGDIWCSILIFFMGRSSSSVSSDPCGCTVGPALRSRGAEWSIEDLPLVWWPLLDAAAAAAANSEAEKLAACGAARGPVGGGAAMSA